MKDAFLRKILPQVHKKIINNIHSLERFFEDPEVWHIHEEVSSDIMTRLGLSDEDVDLLLAYLYENQQEQPEDYKNIETFIEPQLRDIKIDKDQFWTVRDTETFVSKAYFPSMAAFMVANNEAKSVGRLEMDWVNLDEEKYSNGSA